MLRSFMILLIGMVFITSCGAAADLSSSGQAETLQPVIETSQSATETPQIVTSTLREAPPSIACYSPPPMMTAPYPGPDQIQSMPALVDLSNATFPNDANMLRGVLANLPATIAGHQRTNFIENEYFFGVEYTEIGRPADEHPSFLRIYIGSVPKQSAHYPWDRFGLFRNETIQRDQDVFWTERKWQEQVSKPDMLTCYPTFMLSWLPPNNDFGFGARASRREDLEALVSAFITTIASSPAPVSKLPVTPTPIPTVAP
ncbi:MAG TPA: hypothetical protein VGD58_20615 [Herpetosiphonaceae bacterium]